MEQTNRLEVGTEIHYNGDQANRPADGRILKIIPEDSFCGKMVVIKWDKERPESSVPVCMFETDRTGTLFETKRAFMTRRKTLLEKLYGMN